ncbi:zona pellucida sperm-binding protein 4-like [Scyliorhinus canicula]|uniref:zona pellucida sperm-binding protein 4-like n=1 Tax=Scyliorhinus canicula TaxID=7830 RepID=UPI0018F6EBA1|nr:zona pellucida sperm-binding protein 4-like [Scyliorhinus canicula]
MLNTFPRNPWKWDWSMFPAIKRAGVWGSHYPDSVTRVGRWLGVCSLCLLAGSLLSAQPPLLGNDVCVPEPGWRFECGHSGVSSTECSRQGCCFDPQSSSHHPCFYNLRKSPVCTADGQFLIVISRNLTRPALNLSSLYVKDGQEAECKPKLTTAQFVTFHFPITSCGSSKRMSIEGSKHFPTK